jgi:hypothetical protein
MIGKLTNSLISYSTETATSTDSDPIKYKDLDGDRQFAYISYLILATLCMVTFVLLLWIMYKVIKKVRGTDIVIPMMLFMLQMSAIGKCLPF